MTSNGCGVYVGSFRPGDWCDEETKCYKYGFSAAISSRIRAHESGKEYPEFKTEKVVAVCGERLARKVEARLGELIEERGLRLKHHGNFKECFTATEKEFEDLVDKLEQELDTMVDDFTGLKCEFCGAVLSSKAHLYRHYNTRKCREARGRRAKDEVCPGCQSRFSRKDSLSRHIDAGCIPYERKRVEEAQKREYEQTVKVRDLELQLRVRENEEAAKVHELELQMHIREGEIARLVADARRREEV
jgi:hypothetical protein